MNDFAGKKVIITGATGLMGSHLAKKLLESGAEVYALGRSMAKLKMVFDSEADNKALKLVEADISRSLGDNTSAVDFIFHAASPIAGNEIKTLPVDTISANLNGAINCLEHLRKQSADGHGGKLVLFSSATVYGNPVKDENDVTVTEEQTGSADALHTPNTPYSESKRMIEVLASAYYRQYGVDSVIARIGYVYGYSKSKPDTAFYEFINEAVSGQNIVLNNSGMGRRDNIHVDDVVNGLMLIASSGASTEAYNISSNGDLGNFKAIDEIAAIMADSVNRMRTDRTVNAVVKPMEGKRKPGMKLDNSKLKALGWNVGVSLEDGIYKTIHSYLNDMEQK